MNNLPEQQPNDNIFYLVMAIIIFVVVWLFSHILFWMAKLAAYGRI